MICPNCNSVLIEGSRFCENCGAKIEEQVASAATQQTQDVPPAATQQVQNTPKKKPLDKRIIGVAVAVLAIIVLVIVCVKTHKHKINLSDYVTVEFSGYDTRGKADVTFDYDAFYKELEEHAKVSKKDASKLRKQLEDLDLGSIAEGLSDISDSVSYMGACKNLDWELSKESELSNGDEVSLTFTYDNEAAKKYGIKFAADESEYRVEGLKEIEVIDAFADIVVTFSGVSPNVSASIENNSKNEAVKKQYFAIDNNGHFKKGDTVTVTIDSSDENLIEEYGCVFKETSKEYTCENVDEYITDGSALSEDVLASMKEQTKDVIDSYFATNNGEIKGSSIEYAGYYFLSKKDDSESSWGDTNIAYVVYSAKVKSKEKKFKETTVYMPIKFTNIIKYADGTDFVDLNRTDIQGSTDLSFGWWSTVKGYTKESDMKNELVTSQKSTYNAASFGELE